MHCVHDRATTTVLHATSAPLHSFGARSCVARADQHLMTRALRAARARLGVTRVDPWAKRVDHCVKRVSHRATNDDCRLSNVLSRTERARVRAQNARLRATGSPLSTTSRRLRMPEVSLSRAKAP